MYGLSGSLRKYRRAKKLTQAQVAEKIGVRRSTYSRYEQGTNRPSWKILARLADFYGITMDELVGRTNSEVLESESRGEQRTEQIKEERSVQKMLSLYWSANHFAREMALLILENGQTKGAEEEKEE